MWVVDCVMLWFTGEGNQENIAAVVTDNRLASLHKARVYGLGVYY